MSWSLGSWREGGCSAGLGCSLEPCVMADLLPYVGRACLYYLERKTDGHKQNSADSCCTWQWGPATQISNYIARLLLGKSLLPVSQQCSRLHGYKLLLFPSNYLVYLRGASAINGAIEILTHSASRGASTKAKYRSVYMSYRPSIKSSSSSLLLLALVRDRSCLFTGRGLILAERTKDVAPDFKGAQIVYTSTKNLAWSWSQALCTMCARRILMYLYQKGESLDYLQDVYFLKLPCSLNNLFVILRGRCLYHPLGRVSLLVCQFVPLLQWLVNQPLCK